MANDLKPCPFCGGEATYDTNGNEYWVICKQCGSVSGRTFFSGKKGKEIITKAWNRRTKDVNAET